MHPGRWALECGPRFNQVSKFRKVNRNEWVISTKIFTEPGFLDSSLGDVSVKLIRWRTYRNLGSKLLVARIVARKDDIRLSWWGKCGRQLTWLGTSILIVRSFNMVLDETFEHVDMFASDLDWTCHWKSDWLCMKLDLNVGVGTSGKQPSTFRELFFPDKFDLFIHFK